MRLSKVLKALESGSIRTLDRYIENRPKRRRRGVWAGVFLLIGWFGLIGLVGLIV
ncbi:MAG: hypothetical protein GSR85_08480 [Desulfurococcales archaeon]|nr:hypothetical protein [Desulfurococcales archaeon]